MAEVEITIKMTKSGNGHMLVKEFGKRGKQVGEASYPFKEYRELLWFFTIEMVELWKRQLKS